MGPKRKIELDESKDSESYKHRRSSLRVNLSYNTQSDSGNESLGRTIQVEKDEPRTVGRLSMNKSAYNKTNCRADNGKTGNTSECATNNDSKVSLWIEKGVQLKHLTIDVEDISAKEQALDTNCKRLKDAILNKTKEIFDKRDKLSIKTATVLERNRSANEVVHNLNADESVLTLGTMTDHLANKSMAYDRRREERYSDIIGTPKNKDVNSNAALDRSRLTPKRLFAEEGCRQGCRIVKDVVLRKNLQISLKQVEDSPILGGSNRRLQLSRVRSKLAPPSQLENDDNTQSIALSDRSIRNMGPPIGCSTFIDSTSEKGNGSPTDEANDDVVDTPLVARTTNKIISMEMTDIHGGIRSREKYTLRHEHVGATKSEQEEEFKDKRKEMSARKSEKLTTEDDDVHSDIASNEASVETPAGEGAFVQQVAFLAKRSDKLRETEKCGNRTLVRNEKQGTIILSDSSGATRRSSLNVNTSLDAVVEIGGTRRSDDYGAKRGVKATVTANNDEPIAPYNQRESSSTNRTSLQVNTSVDATCKIAPAWRERDTCLSKGSWVGDKSTENSMRHRSRSGDGHLSKDKDQGAEDIDSLENVSLIERLRNISTRKTCVSRIANVSETRDRRRAINAGSSGITSVAHRNDERTTNADDRHLLRGKDSLENASLIERLRNISMRKASVSRIDNVPEAGDEERRRVINAGFNGATSIAHPTGNKSGDNYSYVESTPYPVSRSVLFRTQLKHRAQNLQGNAVSGSSNVNLTNSEEEDDDDKTRPDVSYPAAIFKRTRVSAGTWKPVVDDTIISADTPSCNPLLPRNKLTVVEDTPSETKLEMNERDSTAEKYIRGARRRKLFSLDERSLCSIAPLSHSFTDENSDVSKKPTLVERNRKKLRKKIPKSRKSSTSFKNSGTRENTERTKGRRRRMCSDDEDMFESAERKEKKTRKPRKVVSKKIVIKRFADEKVLNVLRGSVQSNKEDRAMKNGDSSDDFVVCQMIPTQSNKRKCQKIVIVTTGLSKGDKSLVKSIVGSLGAAEIEQNVSRRTTHVVSTGVRTMNLLRGIIRGCWLVALEWVFESLENNAWLNPEKFEMKHFSKAVMENRKDRQLFGLSYIPELFATCGLVYIEAKTTLPCDSLKELVKTAGGYITENPKFAKVIVGASGLKETWIIDSITTGELQAVEFYQRK